MIIGPENVAQSVIFSEISRNVIDNFSGLCNSIYQTVLDNPQNQKDWSDLINRDFMDKFHAFQATLSVTAGLVDGKTLLPLAPKEALLGVDENMPILSNVSKEKVHVLETFIVTWTKQIRTVLLQDPEKVHAPNVRAEPLHEIQFWRSKSANLASIIEQLDSPAIQTVIESLSEFDSAYTTPFVKLRRDLETAATEASNNHRFVSTLTGLVTKLSSDSLDYSNMEQLFDPVLHYVLLIWKHSKYYNTPNRLVILLRLVCNSIIIQSQRFIGGQQIFNMVNNEEAGEAFEKVVKVLTACTNFKEKYEVYKDISEQQERMSAGWKIQASSVFGKLDEFRERCRDILEFIKTIIQYFKLEKVEIGGTKGAELSRSLAGILKAFRDAVGVFQAVPYDVMTVSETDKFDEDYFKFRKSVKELDKRLCFVIASGFDDLDTIVQRIKLLDSFEGLWDRPLLQEELDKRFQALLVHYKKDLRQVHKLYMDDRSSIGTNSDDSPMYLNLPPIAGAIYWARSLLMRVQEPMPKLVQYSRLLRDKSEEFKEVEKLASSLVSTFDEYEQQMYSMWESESIAQAKEKLELKVLARRKPTGLVGLNFDPAIVRLLKEVKYLKYFGFQVPPVAMAMFDRAETYRKWTGELDIVIGKYNGVLTQLLPVEGPLLQDRIALMDKVLGPAIIDLEYKDEDRIGPFIDQAKSVVGDVSGVVGVLKSNLSKISAILAKWSQAPLIERKNKPMSPEEFDSIHKSLMGVKLLQISDDGKEIHKLIRDSNEALRVSKQSANWKAYLDFINNVIVEGFVAAIAVSLQFLCQVFDPFEIDKSELPPLFDLNLDLNPDDGQVVFDPPISKCVGSGYTSVREIVEGWIKDFFSIATVMVRIDSGVGDYLGEVENHSLIQGLLSQVSDLVDNTEGKAMEYRQQFMEYSFLWTESVDVGFNLFLSQDKNLVDLVNGFEENGLSWMEIMSIVGVDIGRRIPRLSLFDERITKLEQLKISISNTKNPVDIHWLRVNSQGFKISLVQFVTRWETQFVGFLDSFVGDRIAVLERFMRNITVGLTGAKSGESVSDQQLYQIMTNIKDVKLAMNALKLLFPPVRDMVTLLKKHGHSINDELLAQLEQIPVKWEEIIRLAFDEKERILPLQNAEMEKIRGKIDAFGKDVEEYRSKFLSQCPFSPGLTVAEAMEVLDRFAIETESMMKRGKEFNNLELLFDLTLSGYRELKACQTELTQLRSVWEMVSFVETTFAQWNAMLWDVIDTDDLLLSVKDIMTNVKGMDKGVKLWKVYTWLGDQVKNMSTVLPLISELHSDTMRDRHWRQLMDVTGVSFVKGPEFSFQNVLELKLHKLADDVSEIVSQSSKEFKIEKKLSQIKTTWLKLTIEFDRSRDDGLPLLVNLGAIVEVLESHSLEIMGMVSQGRFIEFCKPDVDEWSGKLRTVDAVLTIWQKVLRNWSRLEPIFLLSDDIRSQLPDDSKRFEALDREWKDLMMSVGQLTSVIDICCAEGREELLSRLNGSIELCEKSLNDYLEQKKKVFPRFYFVANQALLDILSNGNKPLKVAQYLGDCFDGVKTLNFEKDKDGGKIVSGMYSKDSEYVPFHDDLVLEGAVELYLCGLERHIRNQLRDILESARNSADNWEVDKPREIWLQDYCTQLALVATQIVWTEETARAFDELEGGSESVMKDYKRVCDDRIEKLIKQVQQPLSYDLRNKVITIITIDVHARDVIDKFVQLKLTDASAFQWQSQLRFYWSAAPSGLVSFTEADAKTCLVRICDWTTVYAYEYVGNCGRLVITPLTDRCYLTLTQALNLVMGSAPAGPAGTGKTETTKDLSRAIGLPIVVFNCSDQMSYLSMAQICKGLASSGAWGCFDEFNRISIEVLSVVTTQVKSVLDAIKENASRFLFMDDEIKLVKTCGFFITMNPGYAGRTELPESLKSLFRSCAMCVPDLTFICENMLLSEGFLQSRQLARKFVCLYSLCRELLSPQMHYDWGLRAVKSLLRQAGTLKRADPNMDEYSILMRALRDFNTPKIVTEDLPIFLRLISDLFPGVIADPKNSADLEKIIKQVTKEKGLQPDAAFVTKVAGLLDILGVRHCCFIIGPPGSAKTQVWKTLMDTLKAMGQDGMYETLNPKAITSDELYGIMTKTKEWRDGAISVIMRNMSKEINGYKSSHIHKWIVLDGDIDAKWIESMNTVMDDNKVLTLVSNERIPFTPTMRMLLEVQDMIHASPATVSRGGVLFINETDIGWKPVIDSWREKLENPVAQSTFYLLFNNYFDGNIEYIRKNFVFTCPMLDIGLVQSICCFVDALLAGGSKEVVELMKAAPVDQLKLIYEAYFMYAFMWAVGGAVADDKTVNHRKNFNQWLRLTFSKVKFPDNGDPLDYRFDVVTMSWVHWDQFVRVYAPVGGESRIFSKVVVSNTEIERMKFNLSLHVKMGKPVLFCGVAGTGKSTIVRDYLAELAASSDQYSSASINLNSYTDSLALQSMMEGYLDKRTGRTFGPPGNRKCLYFIDDLNMPYVDEYDTQSAAMLLFQIMSHRSVFDRTHLEERKDIADVQFVSCMNPKAGSFMVNGRLQRHFSVFTTYAPTGELITQIYSQIVNTHLQAFDSPIQALQGGIVNATIDVLNAIGNNPLFLPSARKFHYQFNLRDVSNIVQGLLNTSASIYRGSGCAIKYLRVWLHECNRVFSDRLIDRQDIDDMAKIIQACAKKNFPSSVSMDELFCPDLICTSFVSQHGGNEKQYMMTKDMGTLRKCLEEKLAEYNESFAEMNLVLFDAAIEHITRICRVIDQPCGHALLVGVGGSGKQSLSRLACYIMKMDVVSILVNQSYGMAELKADLQEFYKKAAVKPGTPHAFLLTDGQIADERFLIYINDLLASGHIPDLFSREEMDGILGNIRTAAKAAGVPDERGALVQFFQERVQRNLHMIICHSPVGDAFRIRARKFPALISSTTVDVFHPWTRDALFNVASKFLADVPLPPELGLIDKIAANMANVHLSIDEANVRFLAVEGRFNYTTPKSFLELISFYKDLLKQKRESVESNIERLEKGLAIMAQVKEKVEGLQQDLSVKMVEVEQKKNATGVLINQVTVASEKAAAEKAIADGEAEKTNALAQEAAAIKAQADAELAEALPAMQAAKDAVNCLTKPAIQELKSLGKPPAECTEVTKAVLILLKNEKKNLDWKSAQKMMNNPGQFLDEVAQFNADSIPEWVLDMVGPVIAQPFFTYETMKSKSQAAAYLANWVVNIIAYNKIYKKVAPLMARVKAATSAKETAEAQLAVVLARVKEVEEKVMALEKTLGDAVREKETTEAEANRCMSKLDLAKRLVNGLSDENSRWTETVRGLRTQGVTLIGDSLLASAFVGYISPFSSGFRLDLWSKKWIADISERGIPFTVGIDPLAVLASEADVATWKNQGLPADRMSVENAAIVTSCARWPLLIDPQLQGVTWLKKRVGEDLVVIQLSQPGWLGKVTRCIQMGGKLLIESVGQELDAILEPLLSRSIIRRGRNSFVIKIGGEEIEYDPKFQLYIQSKLPNPHYRPEIAAQCTIVNFIVTPEGLEDQILAMVVNVEKPELEQEKQTLVRKQNEFKVTLSQLEDELLAQLSAADPATILDNFALIDGLETTKMTAIEIQQQVKLAKETEDTINGLREKYRSVAQEGSMLFFMIIQLSGIEHMYQYSLDSFVGFLYRAIDRTTPVEAESIEHRVIRLIESIRMTIFKWVNRGLFEKHKLILSTLLAFRLLERGLLSEEYNQEQFEFLLGNAIGSKSASSVENSISDWLPNQYWASVQGLIGLPGFELFAQNMVRDAPSRFKEWFNEQAPEDVKLPLDWKRLDSTNPLQKLLVLKCLRPDRMTIGLTNWIASAVPNGRQFTECDASSSFYEVLSSAFEDSNSTTPIFFILSPGADPVKEVEKLGRKLVNLQINVNYHNVAMGQGQDVIAMAKLDLSHKEGHWIILQNIHLMPKWCLELEKKLDQFALEGSHAQFRCFLSADPNVGIPIGILDRSIKLTNEPPQGLTANLKRAFAFFNKETFEEKDSKVKVILFGLCHFHSIMLERKKFGPLGFNMMYPFSIGDLRDSALVLYNYMENSTSSKIPWDDLRYIFGEIMYGGHIVDDWDRKLCKSYLDFFMHDALLDEAEFVPFSDKLSIKSPSPGPHEKFIQFVDQFPTETPVMFGLHPNAEIGFRTSQSLGVLGILKKLNMKATSSGGDEGDGGKSTGGSRAEQLCGEILEEVGAIRFPTDEIAKSISDEERGPYQYVFLQECDCMNLLIRTMTKSLLELQLGFKGELTMSESMEQLAMCLTLEQIPPRWQKVAFPSTRGLVSWLHNLKERCAQLDEWVSDPVRIPKVVDLSKLFNPQSFLTAIKQICCQQQMMELDKLVVYTEVTKRDKAQIESPAREGAYVTGLYLSGARWDKVGNCLDESRPKEMFCPMPVICCKAGLEDDLKDTKNVYICPTYATTTRRPHFVFSAQLRTKAPPSKWVLAGVAMILDIGQ